MAYMPGAKGLLFLPGAAIATSTNEVQTLTFGGVPAGNYVLSVRGYQVDHCLVGQRQRHAVGRTASGPRWRARGGRGHDCSIRRCLDRWRRHGAAHV